MLCMIVHIKQSGRSILSSNLEYIYIQSVGVDEQDVLSEEGVGRCINQNYRPPVVEFFSRVVDFIVF